MVWEVLHVADVVSFSLLYVAAWDTQILKPYCLLLFPM